MAPAISAVPVADPGEVPSPDAAAPKVATTTDVEGGVAPPFP